MVIFFIADQFRCAHLTLFTICGHMAAWPCSSSPDTHFFISNPIFGLSLELLSEVPEMRLKVAMKLLTIFDDYRLKSTKFGKIEES